MDSTHNALVNDRAIVREYQEALEDGLLLVAERIVKANPDLRYAFAFVWIAWDAKRRTRS